MNSIDNSPKDRNTEDNLITTQMQLKIPFWLSAESDHSDRSEGGGSSWYCGAHPAPYDLIMLFFAA